MRSWLIPKLEIQSPRPFVETLGVLTNKVKDGSIKIKKLSDAPLWIRIIARDNYCAYKNTVYVPQFHLFLIQSESKDDSSVAMSKLLPWVMIVSDGKVNTPINFFKSLYQLKIRCFYWLYEYFYLMAADNKYSGLIRLGFMTTRKRFGIIKLEYEEIEFILNHYLSK